MTLSRHTRHGLMVLTIAIAAMTSTGCVGPFGPCTARGPIIGNLRPVVVDGVPEPTAAVVTRTVCTPVSVVITVTIELDTPTETQHLLVYFTKLPPTDGGYKATFKAAKDIK